MMTLLAILLFILFAGFVAFTMSEAVVKGRIHFLLLFLVIFLPFYTVFQSFIYLHTDSVLLVRCIQYSKEFVIFSFLISWILRRPAIFQLKWNLVLLDYFFLAFLLLSFIYLVFPLGEAAFVSKAVYFKNILLMGLMYFFGRNTWLDFEKWRMIFTAIFVITVLAFLVVSWEKFTGTHFHSMIGFSKYNLGINEAEATGNYGLTWTFETALGQKRFGSIFSNQLEFSASMLVGFGSALIFLLSVPFRTNKLKYISLIFLVFLCVSFAFSRASFAAFFLMIFFMAVVLKLYRLIFIGAFCGALASVYLLVLAPQDIQFFVLDTITFRNHSSITHLIEWIEAVESMIANPLGIGLAMSGNAGGVEGDLKIGGENQFLVFGVQLGYLGFLLYLGMVILAIQTSWKAFRRAGSRQHQIVPFVAATVKFGFLLPLMTANAEIYLYIAFLSWWMVGYSVRTLEVSSADIKPLNA